MRTAFPEGMEEFHLLLYCEGKQKGTLLEASVRTQLFCNMVVSETGNPVNANLSKTETQVPLPPIKRHAIERPDLRRLRKTYEKMYAAGRILHVSNFCDKFTKIVDTLQTWVVTNRPQQFLHSGLTTLVDLLSSGSFCSMMLLLKWKVANLKGSPTF